ncbi:hypothetical protein SISNIDRAFT_457834 [Sistotremastrum niveocremeum HHB9708]|uniref:Autophagy-related protein 14 n=1 Tax=Sistotremastrum niveocremeum HHB9708 TaxID=1314777 RepID=A0A164R720_9AGAM|nr:hypothetical protein SISNIDRAFT_457834 [Sistotremastrum niveocremeum HHB9708]
MTSAGEERTLDSLVPRRIRHITGIQIRNLTRFPARDAVASVLAAPSDVHTISDDIDLTLSRRRTRKISVTSTSTLKLGAEDPDVSDGLRGHRRNLSRGSYGSGKAPSSGPGVAGPSTVPLPRTRPRTTSQASLRQVNVFNIPTSAPIPNPAALGASFPAWDVRLSESDLEKIFASRLVETYITLSHSPESMDDLASASPTEPMLMSPPKRGKLKRATSSLSTQQSSRESSPAALRNTSSRDTPTPRSPRLRGGKLQTSPRHIPHSKLSNESGTESSHGGGGTPKSSETPKPFYVSPVHRPSTNPKFWHMDHHSDFDPSADKSSSRVTLKLWGRVPVDRGRSTLGVDSKGKGKETLHSGPETPHEWRIMEEWDIDLQELIPLDQEMTLEPWNLPPNSLVMSLSSDNKLLYLPSHNKIPQPPSPFSGGNTSDPEVAESRAKRKALREKTEKEAVQKSLRETRMKTSASWQELVSLTSVQSSIADVRESTRHILADCEVLLGPNSSFAKRRNLSALEQIVSTATKDAQTSQDNRSQLESLVLEKRRALEARRIAMRSAYDIHKQDLRAYRKDGDVCMEERSKNHDLQGKLAPTRITLLSTLSSIFPIEIVSPSDLLFGIVSVPLPIPQTPKDPAPPLSMHAFPEINEETIAAALGYVAQLVQLTAAYMGNALVYPVTCIGSRSVIKDPISTMMGPRKFPLYSKGVDTYRFEYAVFLLNKDIEMLMSDRDLRALDLRHTLPNLKNLLLTLTNGEGAKLERPRRSLLTSSSLESLKTLNPTVETSTSLATHVQSADESSTPRQENVKPKAFFESWRIMRPRPHTATNRNATVENTNGDAHPESPPPATNGGLPDARGDIPNGEVVTQNGINIAHRRSGRSSPSQAEIGKAGTKEKHGAVGLNVDVVSPRPIVTETEGAV